MLPTDMIWTILVLLPKVNTYTCGIGLLLVLWKAVEDIIYTHINMAVMFNDVLHGFCACRGTGTANTELKMSQELASIYQEPLFLVSYALWFSISIALVTWLLIFYELML